MASLQPIFAVEVELNGIGGGWTDLRAAGDVFAASGVTIRHGIEGSSPFDNVASAGIASFTLLNSTANSGGLLGYYSPHHASVRSGWRLGIGCRVRIQDPVTLTWHTRHVGRIDAIDPVPGKRLARLVSVIAADWLDEAARFTISPTIGEQIDKSWDGVLVAILAQMPVQPTAVSLNSGSDTYPYALDTSPHGKQKALAEFKKLADSESGLIFLKANGTFRAEDRHVRMVTTASAWTLPEADYQELDMPSTRDDIINTVRVTTHPRIVDLTPTHVVYRQANVISFAAGETKTLMGSYRDDDTGEPIGATAIGTPSHTANTAADGSGTNVTSSYTIVPTYGPSGPRVLVTNGTGASFLTSLVLTGKRILDHGTAQHEALDAPSIALHGVHAVEFDMPYQAQEAVGQGAANFYLSKFKNPLAQARSIRVVGRTSALLTQILTRDLSDRITLSETVTGVSNAFYINGIELTVIETGHVQATYILTTAQDPYAGLYWRVGTSVLGTNTTLAPF